MEFEARTQVGLIYCSSLSLCPIGTAAFSTGRSRTEPDSTRQHPYLCIKTKSTYLSTYVLRLAATFLSRSHFGAECNHFSRIYLSKAARSRRIFKRHFQSTPQPEINRVINSSVIDMNRGLGHNRKESSIKGCRSQIVNTFIRRYERKNVFIIKCIRINSERIG